MVNEVRLGGTVKRNADAGTARNGRRILDFAIQVMDEDEGRINIFDCRVTDRSDAMDELEGFVTEGEQLEIAGHLAKQTCTQSERLAGAMVDVRTTQTIILVDRVIESEE